MVHGGIPTKKKSIPGSGIGADDNDRVVDYTCAGGAATKTTSGQQPYLGCTTTFGHAVAVAGATAISSGSTYSASAVTEAAGQGIGANSIAVRFKLGDFAATTGGQTSSTVSSPFPFEARK